MTLIAFGYHPVKNIINSPYFKIKKVILIEDKYNKDSELINSLEEKSINFQLTKREIFTRAGYPKNSQGIIALVEYNYWTIKEIILEVKNKKKNPLLLMLDNIEDPHNLGAIIRSSAAFDVDGIIISSRNQVEINSTVIKVSAGGVAFLPVCKVDSLLSAINDLKNNDYQIISTSCDESSIDVNEVNNLRKKFALCLILGNEQEGIRNSIIKKSDYLFSIPINKKIGSLNVSSACAITLFALREKN